MPQPAPERTSPSSTAAVVPYRQRMRGEPGAEVAVDHRVHEVFLDDWRPLLKGQAYRVLADIVGRIYMGQSDAAPPHLKGYSFAKQETMSAALSMPLATYERWFAVVKAAGAIEVRRRFMKSATISLRWPPQVPTAKPRPLKSEGNVPLKTEGSYLEEDLFGAEKIHQLVPERPADHRTVAKGLIERKSSSGASEPDPATVVTPTVEVDWRKLRSDAELIMAQRNRKTAEVLWKFAEPEIEAARALRFSRAQAIVLPALDHLRELRRRAG